MGRPERTEYFTIAEVFDMINIIGLAVRDGLYDPSKLEDPGFKGISYRCLATLENPPDTIVVKK